MATVAVPKFTRVLETRKTAEAENMLSAVRTEQEKRCTFGDEYSLKFDSLPVASSLQSNSGRVASSANYEYTLNGRGSFVEGWKGVYYPHPPGSRSKLSFLRDGFHILRAVIRYARRPPRAGKSLSGQ